MKLHKIFLILGVIFFLLIAVLLLRRGETIVQEPAEVRSGGYRRGGRSGGGKQLGHGGGHGSSLDDGDPGKLVDGYAAGSAHDSREGSPPARCS